MDTEKTWRDTTGSTMVEVIIAMAIFGTSMAMLLGNVVTMTDHNRTSEERATASSFNRSTLEDIRGRGIDDILAYQIPVDNKELGLINLPGMGMAEVSAFAVLQDPQTGTTRLFELGVDYPETVPNPPNPIEIQVEVAQVQEYGSPGSYGRTGFQYTASTLISY